MDETLGMLNKYLSDKDKSESKDERVLREIRTREATRALLNFGVSYVENGQKIPEKLSEFLVLCISNSKNNEHLYAPLLSIMTSNPNPHDNFFKEEFELRMIMLEMVCGYNHTKVYRARYGNVVSLNIDKFGPVLAKGTHRRTHEINTCDQILEIKKGFGAKNNLTITEVMYAAYSEGANIAWENKKMTYESIRALFNTIRGSGLNTDKEKRMGLRAQFKEIEGLALDAEGKFIVDKEGKLVSKVNEPKSNNH
ncbi:hypothetical protein swp_3227 [Shewanella piezotolerans WP3]|uniref:Uncharacterized protein n=2 Tax=Shewanella TaxID=22 RepID=B8CRC5_SHEPW|nr:hypothetical protein swp_3227 [Shewanella piezotolerans WP3]